MDFSDLFDFASDAYGSFAETEAEKKKLAAAQANLKATQAGAASTQRLLIIGGVILAAVLAVVFIFRSK